MKHHLDFANYLKTIGYFLHEIPILDGTRRRISFSSDPQKQDAWYEGLRKGDIESITFHDYRHDRRYTWVSGRPSATSAQNIDFSRGTRLHHQARESELKIQWEKMALEAAEIWEAARVETAEHPYTAKKCIAPTHFRFRTFNGYRELLVPMRDASGTIKNVQRILPDGSKRFLKGAMVAGLYGLAGQVPAKGYQGEIAITEGIATAASVSQITGLACFASMSAGNLLRVARIVRDAYPDASILIAGDDDRLGKDGKPRPLSANTGRTKGYEAAHQVGALALFPLFADPLSRGTDFNDLCCEEGDEAAALAWARGRKIAELDRLLFSLTEEEFPNKAGELAASFEELGLANVTHEELAAKRALVLLRMDSRKNWGNGDGGRLTKVPAYEILPEICAGEVETWHDEDGRAYATFRLGDRSVNAPVESQPFSDFLYNRLREKTGGGPAAGRECIAACIASMAALARCGSPMKQTHYRVAHDPASGGIWLDLAREDGQMVNIGRGGWSLTKTSHLKFVTSASKNELPVPQLDPESTGFLPLWKILNVAAEDRCLIAGFLLGAMQTSAPGFGLSLFGQMGSAKSMGTRILRRILDPQAAVFQTINSRNVDQLGLTCLRQLIPCFENLSWLDSQCQDLMCSLITGLSVKTRKLYTDEDLITYTVRRVFIINGITNVCSRSDLAQRVIPVCLLPPPEGEERKTEREIEEIFESCRPHLLATIVDAVVMALNNRTKAAEFLTANKLDHRMADALEFITAGERALGFEMGSFGRRLQELQIEAAQEALDGHPVVIAIESLLEQSGVGKWRGTHEEILAEMVRIDPDAKRSKFIPHDNTSLGNWIKRETPRLRVSHGIEVGPPVKERVDGRRLRFREIHLLESGKQSSPGKEMAQK